MRLPDFLIIGAMKAGTSSLHRYLEQHPDVFASNRKELDFFTRRYEQGLTWYRRRFPAGDQVAGESSPNYLKAHLWPETAERIRTHLPDARMLCVLRDPVDRTLSHYLHRVWRGRESRPWREALVPGCNVLQTSRYGWQLRHYLDHFPPEQILLLTTEGLARDPAGTVGRALRFIGVDDTVPIDTSQRHNVTAVNLQEAGAPVPEDPGIVIDAATGRSTLTAAARATLADEFRDDLAQLRSWWPEFPGWQL